MSRRRKYSYLVMSALIGVLLMMPAVTTADTEGHSQTHRKVNAVVTGEKSGLLTVKTQDGSSLSLNPNASRRHGHEVPKVGDEVTITLDENNQVIEVHPKGEGGKHRFVTGKLVHVGKMKKEIKIQTPEGEKVFPIERLEIKTGGIEEGTMVTAEVNEGGTIIDLHRAEGDATKH
jgi:hypothetical protein